MSAQGLARDLARVAVVALAALAACGRGGGSGTGAGGEAPSGGGGAAGASSGAASVPAPVAKAQALPAWRSGPDGSAWDALSWVRVSHSDAVEVLVCDPAAERAAQALPHPTLRSDDAVDARRWLLREIGLPEDSAHVVVTLREREDPHGRVVRLRAAKVSASLDAVRRGALAHGGVEASEAGLPCWRMGDAEGGSVTAWADGWLLRVSADQIGELGLALEARRGTGGARATDGLAEAFGALPDRLPVEVEWGPKFGDFGPLKTPPSAILTAASTDDGAVEVGFSAMVFRSEAERTGALPVLSTMMERVAAAGKAGPAVFDGRGRILRMGVTTVRGPQAYARRAQEDLRALRDALRSRRDAIGRFPTTEEGLASLASDPASLDPFLGVLPRDPWGHPYHYRFPHPTKPDEVDLRSAGPDGEIDTEDDEF